MFINEVERTISLARDRAEVENIFSFGKSCWRTLNVLNTESIWIQIVENELLSAWVNIPRAIN